MEEPTGGRRQYRRRGEIDPNATVSGHRSVTIVAVAMRKDVDVVVRLPLGVVATLVESCRHIFSIYCICFKQNAAVTAIVHECCRVLVSKQRGAG